MFEAGLIDKEFVVKDGGKVSEGTTNGNIGMLFGQHWIPFWPLQDGKNRNTNADWRPFPIPSADGTPPKTMAGENDAHWSTYAWIGPDGPYSVIDGYFKNGQTIQSAYIKANTPSMTERGAALSQLRVEMFTKIITGTESPDTFDEYVVTWKRLGGDDITNEVNAVN